MKRSPIMVFAGSFWTGSSESGLLDGFRAQGWAVQEADIDSYVSRANNLASRVFARLNARAVEDAYRRNLVRLCETLRPDVFFTLKAPFLDRATLARIKATGARLVMFWPDVEFHHPLVQQDTFADYDLFITTKSYHVDWLRERLAPERVVFMHHGYVSRLHRPLFQNFGEDDYDTDILYVGNHTPYKQSWLQPVAAAFADNTMRIAGRWWEAAFPATHGGAGKAGGFALAGPLTGYAYPMAVQCARINLGIHSGRVCSDWQDLVSTRTFEIPAARGFMLHIDNDEVRSLFTPGEEIDVFSSSEELVEKIRFYLPRPDLRRAMIERAYARCTPAYSADARAAEVLRHVAALA